MTRKVLLDTDIGTDIDDALCLTYLLANPACELMGITTVTGEPEKRAMMASALCKLAGKEIPIYPGYADPLLIEQQQKTAQQAVELHKWEHQKSFSRGKALEFLAKTIRKHPGEISLLTIGPLTNIGLLFAIDKEIPLLLKELVIMGGNFFRMIKDNEALEWNIRGDAHASAIVYNSDVANHRSVGLDVTSRVTIHKDDFRKQFKHDLFAPVRDFAEIWFEYSPIITFHDPLAATTLFDDTICEFTKGRVNIDIYDKENLGLSDFHENNGPHEVAKRVNKERFFEHYLSFF